MEITHIQKNIHTSPRKLRLVADLVRSLKPSLAIQALNFTPKAAASDLAKAIKTSLANATVQNLDASILVFKRLEVNEELKMKRMRAAGRSRRRPYVKKTSQVKIVLSDEVKGGASS